MMGPLDLARFVSEFSLTAAIVVVPLFLVVAAATLVGRQRLAPWFRHALWSLVLVRLVLPVSIGSPLSMQGAWHRLTTGGDLDRHDIFDIPVSYSQELPIDNSLGQVLPAPNVEPLAAVQASAPPSPPVVNLVDWGWGLALSSLVVGCLLLCIWSLVTTVRLGRRIRNGTVVAEASSLDLLAEGCRAFGIHRAVTMSRISGWSCPATIGIRRPQILLPEDSVHWNEAELRHVVWHELAHIRRYDAAWNSLLTIVRCLHWWNPMFWWAQRCWLAERELACDALVVERLGAGQAADYGRTLLAFVERLGSTRRWSVGSVPGLVSLLGEKMTIRRRLKALVTPVGQHSTLQHRLAWSGLIALALVGLTDAAPPATQVARESSITLPENAIWRGSPARMMPTTEVRYPIEAEIAKLRQDQPEMSERVAAKNLQAEVACMLGVGDFVRPMENPDLCGPVSLIANRELVVQATAEQHLRVSEMLECRRKYGFIRQVVLDTIWVTTPGEIADLFPGDGGEILGPEEGRLPNAESSVEDSIRTESVVPAYVRVLKRGEVDRTRLTSRRDVNLLQSPRITIFEGNTARVSTDMTHPFVTGFIDEGKEKRLARITECLLGTDLRVTAHYDDAGRRATLRISYRYSELVDVEILNLKIGQKKDAVAVQVPHLTGSRVELTIDVEDGETVLVAPLRRDKDGQLRVGLISPRLFTFDQSTGEVTYSHPGAEDGRR